MEKEHILKDVLKAVDMCVSVGLYFANIHHDHAAREFYKESTTLLEFIEESLHQKNAPRKSAAFKKDEVDVCKAADKTVACYSENSHRSQAAPEFYKEWLNLLRSVQKSFSLISEAIPEVIRKTLLGPRNEEPRKVKKNRQ